MVLGVHLPGIVARRDGSWTGGRGWGEGGGGTEMQKEDPVTGDQPGLMTMLINIFEASATRPRRHETARSRRLA